MQIGSANLCYLDSLKRKRTPARVCTLMLSPSPFTFCASMSPPYLMALTACCNAHALQFACNTFNQDPGELADPFVAVLACNVKESIALRKRRSTASTGSFALRRRPNESAKSGLKPAKRAASTSLCLPVRTGARCCCCSGAEKSRECAHQTPLVRASLQQQGRIRIRQRRQDKKTHERRADVLPLHVIRPSFCIRWQPFHVLSSHSITSLSISHRATQLICVFR